MPLEKLLTRMIEAMEAQTAAIALQTEAIADLAQVQREALYGEEEESPFAHLGELDDKDDPTDIPATM